MTLSKRALTRKVRARAKNCTKCGGEVTHGLKHPWCDKCRSERENKSKELYGDWETPEQPKKPIGPPRSLKDRGWGARSYRKVTAGPDTLGPGVSSFGGGGGGGGGMGSSPGGSSNSAANPGYTGAPPSPTPDTIHNWKCPICKRGQPNGSDLRDHLWDEHNVRDIG